MRKILLIFISVALTSELSSWPVYIDLNQGESQTVTFRRSKGRDVKCTIGLVGVEYLYETNHWYRIPERFSNRHLREARVTVRVEGQQVTLRQRPYESPKTVGGIRLYVENTRRWAQDASYHAIDDLKKDVRLAVGIDGESWGPTDMLFPISNYRWGSSPYQNTWSSLVPYNSLYYHRGEDFGAIPDRLDVVAILGGSVEATPLPDGDGRSNAIVVKHDSHFTYRISHVNTPHVDPSVLKGAALERGKTIAKTGNTYRRPGAQFLDPHFHINFVYKGQAVSPYPYLVEAYLRDYPDNVIAIAGGYLYAMPGDTVELDAERTITRPGHTVASYRWKLHNGEERDGIRTTLCYQAPGLYTEELLVVTEDGEQDRDFVQVRIWDTEQAKDIAYGWAYHTPVRGLKAGRNVRFWNRLKNTGTQVMIDTGDGSDPAPIGRELIYRYAQSGRYGVTLTATGKLGEPIVVKMEVVVE